MQNQFNEEDIKNFMTITGCKDQEKSVQYLIMSDYKLETAIQLYMDLEGQNLSRQESHQSQTSQGQHSDMTEQQTQLSYQEVKDVNTMIFNQQNPPPQLIKQRSAPDQSLVEQYRKFKEDKRANDDGFIKKVVKNSFNYVTSFFKKQENLGLEFQQYLRTQIIQNQINFHLGNFEDNLKKAQEDMKPLLVYLHNYQSFEVLQNMMKCKNFILMVNKNYLSVGFLQNEQSERFFTSIKVEAPSLLIYRLNLTEQKILMDQIKLSQDTDFEGLSQKLKQMKGIFNKVYIQEEQVKKEVNSQYQYVPNYRQQQQQQYQQQQQQQQQQRQNQQRERDYLRFQQEEAFRLAEQQVREQEEKKKLENEKIMQQQQEEEQRLLKKAQILSNLPEEPIENQGIEILFRFFNGTKQRRFHLNDKIECLFNFISCQEDEFFNNPHSKFDLIQNFPRLSLKDKMESTIEEIFVDSINEQLIVEEQE